MSRMSPTAWVTAEQIFAQGFGLLVFAVQAPLLGPHAFGLAASVMIFVGFWESVAGTAATDALISVHDIDSSHFGTAMVASIFLGLLASLVVVGFAVPLARGFGDPELVPVMRAMATLPLIQALSIVPTAAAQRDMLFRSLTIRTILGLLAGGIVGLVLACVGAGVWALVWQAIVQRCVATIVLWSAVPISLNIMPSRRHLHELSDFALPNMAARTMSWASGQLPRLILGYALGPTRLGLFTLATRLNDIVTQVAIGPKALVARVDLRRFANTPDALGAAVRQVCVHISLIAFPLCIGGAAVTPTLVHAWLDQRWQAAIIPCQIILLTGVPFVTIYVSASLLLALNRPGLEAKLCAFQSIVTILSVACVASFGIISAATAMAASVVIAAPVAISVMHRQCGISLQNSTASQAPALIAASLMGAAVWAIRTPLEAVLRSGTAFPTEVVTGAVIYISLVAMMLPELVLTTLRAFRRSIAPNSKTAPLSPK